MPILGIDAKKCSICMQCIYVCPTRSYNADKVKNQIQFDDSKGCVLCGHCIAACPEDAIFYEDMHGYALDLKKSIITYENMLSLMISKRSIRKYKNKKVPKKTMQKVIDTMKYAPTAMNLHTLKCLIISDEKIKEFTNAIIETVESKEERDIYLKKLEDGINPFFYNAPHILMLYSDNQWDIRNGGIAITYAMLSAETLGLGSCWIGGVRLFLNEKPEIQRKIFGIDEKIVGIMVIGYPAVKYYRAPPRPSIEVDGMENLD